MIEYFVPQKTTKKSKLRIVIFTHRCSHAYRSRAI